MFLPTTLSEMNAQGMAQCDIIIVTPDAYVDHPSFAMALLGRFLEKAGYKVGILSQPRWQDPQSFLALGTPRLAWAVSGGNMDSLVLNYTANKKRRQEDLYAEGGKGFFPGSEPSIKNKIRPDRTVIVYSNAIRQIDKKTPLIIGGLEASLRRIAHYDYWSDSVRRSILVDSRADILVFGMGEYPLLSIARALEAHEDLSALSIPGTAVMRKSLENTPNCQILPPFNEVKQDKMLFAESYKIFFTRQFSTPMAQQQDTRFLVQFPSQSLTSDQLDAVYDLPFMRKPHPRYKNIPAFEMIQHSITAHRGCFGNCSFCAIGVHQGPLVSSRTPASILAEAKNISLLYKNPSLSDIGGPSANMYASSCALGGCENPDCLGAGAPCTHLIPGCEKYRQLLNDVKSLDGINQVFVSSGLRYDPVLLDETLLEALLAHHTFGELKIAPESGSDAVLNLMHKPPVSFFEQFYASFKKICQKLKRSRKLVPYMIAGHPGESAEDALKSARFLKEHDFANDQYQLFTPTPMTLSSVMYHTGINPFTGEKISVEKDFHQLEKRKERLLDRKKSPGLDR